MRWASTWSAPSCESSSTTRISDRSQTGECEISSTISPSASSFSAIIARGVRAPGLVPASDHARLVLAYGREGGLLREQVRVVRQAM
jgi:hypothetical protein